MAGSVNKVILIGNLGNDPDIRSMQSGDEVANLSIATSETWKDKATGERKEKTEWHRVAVFNQNIVNVCKNYLKKGAKVYIEGQLETRSWDDQATGQKKYMTEVVLRPYRSELTMLDSRNSGGGQGGGGYGGGRGDDGMNQDYGYGQPASNNRNQSQSRGPVDELEDEIPF